MPCYRPIEVMVKRKALSGNRTYDNGYPQVVPCGNCVGCRAEQARQWAVRMMHESRCHTENIFVTLTYEKLPENGGLRPKDFSRFIRSLRKERERFSFFGCGEYGAISNRPHYHALLFGVKFSDNDIGFDSTRPLAGRSHDLESTWKRGLCETGTVTMASASYVAGYIQKKVKSRSYSRFNRLTGELLQPEFARMSLRPALGRRWIEKWWRDVYPRDFVVVDGIQAKPPRYYDRWMELDDQQGGTMERRALMDGVRDNRYAEAKQMSKYQMMSGEKIHQARNDLFAARMKI